ncbi:hypothetical protein GCM10025867_07670 [Frondihabitans sucicola]|uniref:Uncharacterized protein n=1 Tax=Frondihabitans sucicola TaxID=1268041 RepID=A0ABM8GJH3_9MICO|nr:Tm-1-like ATP-binding domain-containing protein [Frondihabitans sucicola]BDZ48526.1 hypothetical protein GCM10025867_07670 [Frondihabitans sucicola]
MDSIPATILLVGALDTKAEEYDFVSRRLAERGIASVKMDVGVLGTPRTTADIDRASVARAGGTTLDELIRSADRGKAMTAMAQGASVLARGLVARGAVSGLLVLGGSNAGYVMSRVAPEVPFGTPKMLVSTIVAGDTRPYLGTSDLTMIYPVVDLAGLNSISSVVLARAADALAGMVHGLSQPAGADDRPLVGCSMFGVTTACVSAVLDALALAGVEGHTFHANGVGAAVWRR